MAFGETQNSSNGNNVQRKQADSFINIEMQFGDKKQKLGFIAVDCSNKNMKVLHDHLVNNPDDVAKLAEKLILTFRENKPAEATATAADIFA